MPFLLSSSGSRKKKSYLHDDSEQSTRRRDMIKQKLYAQHDDCDDYLEQQLGRTPPIRGLSSSRSNSSRRVQHPNYIDLSGSFRQSPPGGSGGHIRRPPQRARSEQNGRKTLNAMQTVPPLPPRRIQSFANNFGEVTPESSPESRGNARFSMAAHRDVQRPLRVSPRMSSRLENHHFNEDEDEDDEEFGEVMISPIGHRRPPAQRRRVTVSTETIQKTADAAMRFAPPRRIKSHYPGGRSPRNIGSIGMMDNNVDTSGLSNASNHSSNKDKGLRRGLFRRKSGNSDGTGDTASSSDRSSSFFRKVKRTNSMKRATGLDSSEHSVESQKSWFTSRSNTRSKEDIYNSALHRAKERQAIKHGHKYVRSNSGSESNGSYPGKVSLSEQLSKLPSAANDSDDEYDDNEDDGTESKSIFGSIISKIENIYDDCS